MDPRHLVNMVGWVEDNLDVVSKLDSDIHDIIRFWTAEYSLFALIHCKVCGWDRFIPHIYKH